MLCDAGVVDKRHVSWTWLDKHARDASSSRSRREGRYLYPKSLSLCEAPAPCIEFISFTNCWGVYLAVGAPQFKSDSACDAE